MAHFTLLLFGCIFGMHRVAIGQAPECRTLSSVADSALSVEANSAKGGHIWIHVANLESDGIPVKARRTESQEVGKSMFAT